MTRKEGPGDDVEELGAEFANRTDALDAEVNRVCALLAEKSAAALGTQKEIIHKWMTTDLESAIDFSINTVTLAFNSREQKEAMSAFLDKREPTHG